MAGMAWAAPAGFSQKYAIFPLTDKLECPSVDTVQPEITSLLAAARRGDERAGEQVFPLVYRELKRVAAIHMKRERTEHILEPTALVHEAYLRLMQHKADWHSRTHFFAVASRIMRHVLVDQARRRLAAKRGAGGARVALVGMGPAGRERDADILAIDQALNRLAELSDRQARVVELTFFGDLTEAEVAESLGVSPRTVRRDWVIARAWLHTQLSL